MRESPNIFKGKNDFLKEVEPLEFSRMTDIRFEKEAVTFERG